MEVLNVDYYDHPVFHPNQLRIDTPAIKKLSNDIHRMLWTGSTGGLIVGNSRVGKSVAVQTIRTQLYTRGKTHIPTYYVSIPPRDQSTIAHVHRQLCYSEKIRVTKTDVADELADRYINYILDKSVENNCKEAVLFVDEMQRLQLRQLDAFSEIYDKLTDMGISLVIFFIASEPKCWPLIEEIEKEENSHIRGRFFTEILNFQGIVSKEQLKACLSQYDKLRYPADGATYTEFFLPKETKNGWLLSSFSSDIWRIFRDYQRKYKIDSWPMKYFLRAINPLLTDYLPHYGIDQFDDDIVSECIDNSKLVSSLVHPVK